MIRSKTPFYKDVTFTSPNTSLDSTDITINIYIWSGLAASVPGTPTYQLYKKKYNVDTIEIDYSDFLQDLIDENNLFSWVRVAEVHTTGDLSDVDLEQNSETYLVSGGYLFTLEGRNNTYVNGGVLLSSSENYVYEGEMIKIPYLKENTTDRYSSITVVSHPNNEVNQTITELNSQDTSEKLQEIEVTANVFEDTYIEVSFDSKKIYYDVLKKGLFDTKKVEFFNKYGVKEQIYFYKAHSEKEDITKETYYNRFGNVANGVHRKREFNINSKTAYTLETPYISEDNNEQIRQLFLSPLVWVDGVPVNIKSSNLSYKTQIEDNLISYSIEVENSFNNIGDI